MQKYLQLVVSFLLCLALNTAAAQNERWYDVELLIFKHAKAEHFLTEQWPTTWTIPDTGNSVNPLDISRQHAKYFSKLDSSERTFSGIVKTMEDSSRYEILAYHSWKQMGLNKEQAMSIRINAGRKYKKWQQDNYFGNHGVTENEPEIQSGALFEPVSDADGNIVRYKIPQYTIAADDTQPEDVVYQLDGSIKIILSRFLHIYTDLLLLEPVKLTKERTPISNNTDETAKTGIIEETRSNLDIPEPEEAVIPTTYKLALADNVNDFTTLHGFNIKDHRRMRSGELHHLDHPLIGIMVKITPSKSNSQ